MGLPRLAPQAKFQGASINPYVWLGFDTTLAPPGGNAASQFGVQSEPDIFIFGRASGIYGLKEPIRDAIQNFKDIVLCNDKTWSNYSGLKIGERY